MGACMTETVSFGYSEVSPSEKTVKVGEVFARVARRYDVMNDAMSGGMHRVWKDRFVARVKPRPGEHILDMAGGTGDIAFRMKARGADVTVSDINPAMLEVGQERATLERVSNVVSTCVSSVLEGDRVAIHWIFDFTYPSGKTMRIDEVAMQEWRGDKVFSERFFYEPPKRD